MQKSKDGFVYSPSDLIRFMESPYASWMNRLHLELPGQLTPDEDSAEKQLMAQTGNKHEQNFLQQIWKEGRDVCEIAKDDAAKASQQTREAFQKGREVIYQACLELSPFCGYADFLMKVPGQSVQIYEVLDTKLARSVKPYFLVQLCCYSEMLAALQKSMPEHLQVVLGNGKVESFRVGDFFHYYLHLKSAFLDQMKSFNPDQAPPLPDARANHGRWQSHADKILLASDDLAQIAGINVSQIKKLAASGITTVAALAKAGGQSVPKIPAEILERLVEQADLQVRTRELRAGAKPDELVRPIYKVIKPDQDSPRRGLELLPPYSSKDVYFDMEGFPLFEGGLEYLFGAVCHDRTETDGKLEFNDWWAHDR
jgi:uncharacterized protein